MLGKYLNLQNYIAFKRLFGTEGNKDLLISLLNEVLGSQQKNPIKKVTFLNPEQKPELIAKKQSIADVFCEDDKGIQYIIEMQVSKTEGFQARAQYYASKIFISQMKSGELYEELKCVIFLAFCSFNIFPKKQSYKSEHITLDKKTGENDLEKLSFTFIELNKFDRQRRKDISKLTKEEKFYYFLSNASQITPKQLKVLTLRNKVIKKAYDELDRFSWSLE